MEPVEYVPEQQTEEPETSDTSWYRDIARSLLFLANGVALGLVFGQFLGDEINWWVFVLGIIGTIGLYYAAIKVFKKS